VPRIKRLVREMSQEEAKKLVERIFSQTTESGDPSVFFRIS
jgi:hypothetical protein